LETALNALDEAVARHRKSSNHSDKEVPAMSSAAVATSGEQPRMEEVIETEETLKRFDPPGGQLIARPEANGKAGAQVEHAV
jgi:hypothetical protein